MLFNQAMNVTAKNLLWNFAHLKSELFQINEKILEEVIERFLKSKKSILGTDCRGIIELLSHSRKKHDTFELLETERK